MNIDGHFESPMHKKNEIERTNQLFCHQVRAIFTFVAMPQHRTNIADMIVIIIIRCQIWNRHWRPCLSKHLCHQTTSKKLNPYFVHLLPSYKDYQEMLFVVCPYRVCLLLYQLKIRIPSLYVYTQSCPKNSICLFLIVFNSDL